MTLATLIALRAAEAQGYVTLKSLCRELGVSGSSARLKLRAAGIATTNQVYAWSPDSAELQKVRAVLLGNRAALIG